MEIIYSKPTFFYTKQQNIFDCEKRYTVVLASNKCGKTLCLALWIDMMVSMGEPNSKYCWLAPYSRTTKIGFDLLHDLIINSELFKYLEQTKSKNQFKFNSSDLKITYPNGNIIDFIQGENVSSIYGYKYHGAVVDEAARLKQEIKEIDGKQYLTCPAFEALETTLMNTQGPIKLISNPTIKNNWYYLWWLKVKNKEDERAEAFHISSLDAIKAGFLSQEDFNYAEKEKSPYIFQRDWLGKISDEDGGVFKSEQVYENINDNIEQNLDEAIYFGVDLGFTTGNKSDWTVVTGLNEEGEIVFFRRFKKEGQDLINKLKEYIGNSETYIDATAGGGITIYNLLKEDCSNLEPYTFSNKSKETCIGTLAHYIHTNQISYNNNDVIINELLGYECEINSKGTVTYNNGKSVNHDDAVISIGLAVLKLEEQGEELPFDYFTREYRN